MGIIKAVKLAYDYLKYGEEGEEPEVNRAIDGLDLEIEEGQFIAVLGHNGSGKSTFAKHINGLLVPSEGTLWVDQMDTSCDDDLWKIRQKAGMVFQNPDNQIIGTVVEEDVGFGPENIGVPTEDIWRRVEKSLGEVGMIAYRHHSPNKLSGGQKQRVAIAGVMAMQPKCIVLDEPTAMLDPNGRKEVLKAVRELNRKEKVTVILITHYMEEVVFADDVYVMDNGSVVMHGTPREIFSRVRELKQYRLDVPQVTLLAHELKENGVDIPDGILTIEEFTEALAQKAFGVKKDGYVKGVCESKAEGDLRISGANKDSDVGKQRNGYPNPLASECGDVPMTHENNTILKLENVTYTYNPGTVYEMHALRDVNLDIHQGEFIGIIGHTGSGKSTLIQHFNGLIRPTGGKITFEGDDIWAEGYSLRSLRSQVGLVFQYPEHQLFEADVLTDVCFGPKNQGLTKEECVARAKEALAHVGLEEKFHEKSPFELSGGQKRRVAIAGVLAMNPKVLILDEPTAGLDPKGRDEILDQIAHLHETRGITILLVSHSMEDIAKYVDRIIVMNQGVKTFDDVPKRVFAHYRELEKIGLAAPQITYIMHALKEKGFAVDTMATTVDEATKSVLTALAERGGL